jgi:uncharacterized protein
MLTCQRMGTNMEEAPRCLVINTAFGGDTVIATGSRWAADEDIEGNLLAGRAGTGPGRRTRLLLPMTFRDYLAASRPELARPVPVHVSDLQTPHTANA